MSWKNNKNNYDPNRSKRRKVFCAIFFPTIFLAGAGVSTYFIWRSCHIDIGGGIFDIKTISGKKVLLGFNPSKTKQQIIKALGDTLSVPPEIEEIAENAFYRDEQSTIPTEINKLFFNSKVKKIGSGAFAHWTSLESLVFTNPDIALGSADETIGAFEGCSSINLIDLTEWTSVDASKWGSKTFNGLASSGKIYINNRSLAKQWKTIFQQKYDFDFSENNWIVIPDEIFNIDEDGILYGFNPGIGEEDIKEVFPDKVLRIPNTVTSIAENAFFDPEGEGKSTIPAEWIDDLAFDSSISLTTINKNAFKLAPFTKRLRVPISVTDIKPGAFYGTSITSLTLPNPSVSIEGDEGGNGAFANCQYLAEIHLEAFTEVPDDMGAKTFNNPATQGTIYIDNIDHAADWQNLFEEKYDYDFSEGHWKIQSVNDWEVDVNTNHLEWIVGEEWETEASYDGITVDFDVIKPEYKVKTDDLTVMYNGQKLSGVSIENIGTHYTFTVDPSQLVYGETYISFDFNLNEYYSITLERGIGVKNISLVDIPVDYEQGATFDGTVESLAPAGKLTLDNCYAIWGNNMNPSESIKLWGEDAFIYDEKTPKIFKIKTPTDFEPESKELTIHLDESNQPRWLDIAEPETDEGNVYVGLAKNIYQEQIEFDYHTKNGRRIDQDSDKTYVTINGVNYTLNDSTGVFSMEYSHLIVNPMKISGDIKPDAAIQLHVMTAENDFACSIEYEDESLFDTSAFEIVSAIDNEEVVIKVQPKTNYQVVSDDANRLYAVITFKNGETKTVTNLTVGEIGADDKTPITMDYPGEEYIGLIASIQFHVAADLIS